MKTPHGGFVRALLLIIVIIIVLAGAGIVVYVKSPETILSLIPSSYISKETKAKIFTKQVVKMFPQTIGNYELYSWGPNKISVDTLDCQKMENSTDVRAAGLSGEACVDTAIAQYRDKTSNKVVYVHGMKVWKGEELVDQLISKSSTTETLGGYNVIRMERHEIGWHSARGFDYILTQEGKWKAESDGGVSMNYSERATGDNPVTKYFLSKYPPAKK